jgi:hypothetical protein
MGERKRVSIAVQVILCFIPLVWIIGFFRIEKLIAGILMLIGVAIVAVVIQSFLGEIGFILAWLVSILLPIHYMVKWSNQWNDSISV